MFLVNQAMEHISIGTAGLVGLLGMVVVFIGLILLLAVVALSGKIMAAGQKAPAPAIAPVSAFAPGSAGEMKLFSVPDRDAAMLMAIVADKLGKPLNELRFKSIREV
jgi:Na+-transporting methylmalonyl-CoA/oxaloacetate decarboxylase gamma subunit